MTNPNLLDCLKKGERRTAWQERECSVFELLGRVDNPIHTMIKTYAAVAAVAAMFQDWKHTAPVYRRYMKTESVLIVSKLQSVTKYYENFKKCI